MGQPLFGGESGLLIQKVLDDLATNVAVPDS
jgi:hypothetical protein